MGRPFLNTTKAIIYAEKAKITFNIKGRKEKFTFKNKKLENPAHPQRSYAHELQPVEKKKFRRRHYRNNYQKNQEKVEQAWMIIAIKKEDDGPSATISANVGKGFL